MRTVHETEALRPPDAIPLSAGASNTNKPPRIKLKLPQLPKEEEQQRGASGAGGGGGGGGATGAVSSSEFADGDQIDLSEFGPEIGLNEQELSLPPSELYRLLRRQIHWAEQENVQLRDEWARIGPKRKDSWQEKEAIFNDMMNAGFGYANAVAAAHAARNADNSEEEGEDDNVNDTSHQEDGSGGNENGNGLKQEKENESEDAQSARR